MTTVKLGLPELTSGQAGKELTHNDALAKIDQFAQARIITKSLSTPPGSPANGAMYLVGAAATGLWAGKENNLAWWLTSVGAWSFLAPASGLAVRILDEANATYVCNGTVWAKEEAGTSAPVSVTAGFIPRYADTTGKFLDAGIDPATLATSAYVSAAVAGVSQNPVHSIIMPCLNETSAHTATDDLFRFRMPYGFALTDVRVSLSTAQATGSIFSVKVSENGLSVLNKNITIDNTEKTSTTAADKPLIAVAELGDDSEISVDVKQIGDGTAKGLKLSLVGTRVAPAPQYPVVSNATATVGLAANAYIDAALPAGLKVGDVIIAAIGGWNGAAFTCATPAGWRNIILNSSKYNDTRTFFFSRVVDGTESATTRFVFSGAAVSIAHTRKVDAGTVDADKIYATRYYQDGTPLSPPPATCKSRVSNRLIVGAFARGDLCGAPAYAQSLTTESAGTTGKTGTRVSCGSAVADSTTTGLLPATSTQANRFRDCFTISLPSKQRPTPSLIVGHTHAGTTSVNGYNIPVPTGTRDGDFLVLVVCRADAGYIATPSGFTSALAEDIAGKRLQIFTKTASSEPASYAILSTTLGQIYMVSFRMYGTPSISIGARGTSSSFGVLNYTVPEVTGAITGTLVAFAFAYQGSYMALSSPTMGLLEDRSDIVQNTTAAYFEEGSASGATGTRTIRSDNGNLNSLFFMLKVGV